VRTATLSGPDGGNLITDNDLLVNGRPFAPFTDGCFDGTINDPLLNVGQPAETSYNSVASDRYLGQSRGGTECLQS
jgi:hypothetical protein